MLALVLHVCRLSPLTRLCRVESGQSTRPTPQQTGDKDRRHGGKQPQKHAESARRGQDGHLVQPFVAHVDHVHGDVIVVGAPIGGEPELDSPVDGARHRLTFHAGVLLPTEDKEKYLSFPVCHSSQVVRPQWLGTCSVNTISLCARLGHEHRDLEHAFEFGNACARNSGHGRFHKSLRGDVVDHRLAAALAPPSSWECAAIFRNAVGDGRGAVDAGPQSAMLSYDRSRISPTVSGVSMVTTNSVYSPSRAMGSGVVMRAT